MHVCVPVCWWGHCCTGHDELVKYDARMVYMQVCVYVCACADTAAVVCWNTGLLGPSPLCIAQAAKHPDVSSATQTGGSVCWPPGAACVA